jgi:membrane protease YdiL (CAAX protease family)
MIENIIDVIISPASEYGVVLNTLIFTGIALSYSFIYTLVHGRDKDALPELYKKGMNIIKHSTVEKNYKKLVASVVAGMLLVGVLAPILEEVAFRIGPHIVFTKIFGFAFTEPTTAILAIIPVILSTLIWVKIHEKRTYIPVAIIGILTIKLVFEGMYSGAIIAHSINNLIAITFSFGTVITKAIIKDEVEMYEIDESEDNSGSLGSTKKETVKKKNVVETENSTVKIVNGELKVEQKDTNEHYSTQNKFDIKQKLTEFQFEKS